MDKEIRIKIPEVSIQKRIVSIKKRLDYPEDVQVPPTLRLYHEGWEPPTGEEIREAFFPFTGGQVAKLLGVEARQVRRWIGEDATIPYSAWRLWLIILEKVPNTF